MRPWSPKRAIAISKRRIESAVKQLDAVALEWADVNQGIVDDAERLAEELEQFADAIESEVLERLASGEHVGL